MTGYAPPPKAVRAKLASLTKADRSLPSRAVPLMKQRKAVMATVASDTFKFAKRLLVAVEA